MARDDDSEVSEATEQKLKQAIALLERSAVLRPLPETQALLSSCLGVLASMGMINGMRYGSAASEAGDAARAGLDDGGIRAGGGDDVRAAGRGGGPEVIAEYDLQIAKVLELQDIYIAMARTIEETSIASQRTFVYGWDRAFNQFAENAYNYATVAEEMFNSLTSNMNSAIDSFVENGKLSFSSFAESVIKDIIKIQLRMQASQLLSMGIKFAMGAFSGSAGPEPLGNMGGAGFPGRASGGSVTGNTPYMVGERGAELFVPQRSGTIIPNHQLSSIMGGGGTTFNGPYIANMQAIDTQSGIQFLAKNKMTIWSMNQSANRSIPAGR
jgi:hypothetical protein